MPVAGWRSRTRACWSHEYPALALDTVNRVSVTIRPGSHHDIAPCVELWTRVIVARDGSAVAAEVVKRVQVAFTCPAVRFAVAGTGPTPDGFALTLAQEHRVALLSRLCVDPSVSSRGIGAALVADAVKHAESASCERLDFDVRETNTRAITLYVRAGFLPRNGPRTFDDGDLVVTWSRALTPNSQ